MGDQFNFEPNSTFHGNQFGGENNSQTNYFNVFSNNKDIVKVEEILKEFNQLQVVDEEWKQIFMDGMQDLLELQDAEDEIQESKSKSKLKKVYDFIYKMGKTTNDWKNIMVLPVEFHDKIPKLLEIGNHLKNIVLFKSF